MHREDFFILELISFDNELNLVSRLTAICELYVIIMRQQLVITTLIFLASLFLIEPCKAQNDSNCDSLKFTDFTTNVKRVTSQFNSDFNQRVGRIAKSFIKKECDQDSTYCGETFLKLTKHYSSSSGTELFAFGYALKNSKIEKASASFFVFGIKKNSKILFHDVAEDLMGEIQLELTGLELTKKTTIIWGKMYPYFGEEYGKFKLTIPVGDGNITYEFECHSKGN